MGCGDDAGQVHPHECYDAVHEWQQRANIQHDDRVHDGIESDQGPHIDQSGYAETREINALTLVFAPYRSSKHTLLPQTALFVLCQLACIALGLYKCWSMGLLPTESSDWLAWYKAPRVCAVCLRPADVAAHRAQRCARVMPHTSTESYTVSV